MSLRSQIFNSNTSKQSITLFWGNVISQILIFLSFALFSRFFPMQEIGMYTIFISLTILLSVVAAGRYELAIMLPKEPKNSAMVLFTCLLLSFGFALIYEVLLWSLPFEHWFEKFNKIKHLIYILPLATFLLNAQYGIQQYHIKIEALTKVSLAKILQALIMLSASFLLTNWFGFSATSLVLAWVISHIFSYMFLFKTMLPSLSFFNLNIFNDVLKSYKRYPIHGLVGDFINTFSNEIPNYFLPSMYGLSVQTLYAYGYKVAAIPRNLIGNAVGDIFYKNARNVYLNNKSKLYTYCKKIALSLLILSISLYSIGILFSDFLFPVVFDVQYEKAVPYYKYIALASIFLFVQSPISTISDVVEELKAPLVYNIFVLFVKFLTFFFGVRYIKDPIQMVALYAIVTAFLAIFWIFCLLFIAKIKG